jgi:hypothetical protein
MLGNVFVRLFSAVVTSMSPAQATTVTEAPTLVSLTATQALPAVERLIDIKTEAPVPIECALRENCLAIPVTLKHETSRGSVEEVPFVLPLSPDLVDAARAKLNDAAPVFLRRIHAALKENLEGASAEVRATGEEIANEVAQAVPYHVNPGIEMPVSIEMKVARIAEKTVERSGHKLTITSGTRNAYRQAGAMRTKMDLGENISRLYKHKSAVGEVMSAYRYARTMGMNDEATTHHMAAAIDSLVERGVFLSRHQREGAVDIRTRGLSAHEFNTVRTAAREVGAAVLYESTPPHFHLDL